MKLGFVLLVIGIAIVIWGASGFRTQERVLDVGPIHATREKTHYVPYGEVTGALIAVAGVALMIRGKS
jgi:hypothetical protein